MERMLGRRRKRGISSFAKAMEDNGWREGVRGGRGEKILLQVVTCNIFSP